MARAYIYRGSAYRMKRGHDNAAIADFSEAIRLDPRDANAYYSRANAYNKTGEYDKVDCRLHQICSA